MASEADPRINYKTELQNIRSDIKKYENELSKQRKDEANTLNLLAKLDREIDVTTSYLKSLRSDIERLERQMAERNVAIQQLDSERSKLVELCKKRMVSYYKYQRLHDIDLLMSVESWRQAKAWLKYQKMILENDQRNIQALSRRQQRLQQQQMLLRQEMAEKERRLQEMRQEEMRLRQSRSKREEYLRAIRKDQNLVQKRLLESKKSEKAILDLIARAEQQRLTQSMRKTEIKTPQAITSAGPGFAALKGKMLWPTKGVVVSRFGRQRHPVLNTITENLGIEIQAPRGTPVYSVEAGRVQAITWQRGSGNIVIISHEDGYYTVYAHLEEIAVEENQEVRRGQTIGTVGESGTTNGPLLHFQIWKNTTNLDPEEWLS